MALTRATVQQDQLSPIRRGLVLQWLTIGHGLLETIVAISAGLTVGSVVLWGFGLDSLIEVLSALIVCWRLLVQSNVARSKKVDAVGLRLIGVCFVALGTYVTFDSYQAIHHREIPAESLPGIALAAFSVIVMPFLARAKRRLAAEIDSSAMSADSVQSDLCAYLSGVLLLGLGLDWAFGWWWADPVAALIMVPIMVREGILALRGRACGCASCSGL